MFNRLFRAINFHVHGFVFFLCTIMERFYLWCIGIDGGKNAKFRGWCSIFKANDSRIVLGKNHVYNSSGYTNHIGLNHRCVMTTMQSGAEIVIGDGFGMSSSTITAFTSVRIGNDVRIGANCVIMDGDFHLDDPRTNDPRPVVIDDNVWLGANVVVMKGVHIGCNSVIGVNSVVTKDIPGNVVAGGNPCRVLREL